MIYAVVVAKVAFYLFFCRGACDAREAGKNPARARHCTPDEVAGIDPPGAPGKERRRMTASQETDRAHRAETPCGDLRPFAENVGGDAGVLRGCVRVLFFAHLPRGREALCVRRSANLFARRWFGNFDGCRMLRGGASPAARIRPRAEWMFRRAGAHENTLEVK